MMPRVFTVKWSDSGALDVDSSVRGFDEYGYEEMKENKEERPSLWADRKPEKTPLGTALLP